MVKISPNEAYGSNITEIICDLCGKNCETDDIIFHCEYIKSIKHKGGYDICQYCSLNNDKIEISKSIKIYENNDNNDSDNEYTDIDINSESDIDSEFYPVSGQETDDDQDENITDNNDDDDLKTFDKYNPNHKVTFQAFKHIEYNSLNIRDIPQFINPSKIWKDNVKDLRQSYYPSHLKEVYPKCGCCYQDFSSNISKPLPCLYKIVERCKLQKGYFHNQALMQIEEKNIIMDCCMYCHCLYCLQKQKNNNGSGIGIVKFYSNNNKKSNDNIDIFIFDRLSITWSVRKISQLNQKQLKQYNEICRKTLCKINYISWTNKQIIKFDKENDNNNKHYKIQMDDMFNEYIVEFCHINGFNGGSIRICDFISEKEEKYIIKMVNLIKSHETVINKIFSPSIGKIDVIENLKTKFTIWSGKAMIAYHNKQHPDIYKIKFGIYDDATQKINKMLDKLGDDGQKIIEYLSFTHYLFNVRLNKILKKLNISPIDFVAFQHQNYYSNPIKQMKLRLGKHRDTAKMCDRGFPTITLKNKCKLLWLNRDGDILWEIWKPRRSLVFVRPKSFMAVKVHHALKPNIKDSLSIIGRSFSSHYSIKKEEIKRNKKKQQVIDNNNKLFYKNRDGDILWEIWKPRRSLVFVRPKSFMAVKVHHALKPNIKDSLSIIGRSFSSHYSIKKEEIKRNKKKQQVIDNNNKLFYKEKLKKQMQRELCNVTNKFM